MKAFQWLALPLILFFASQGITQNCRIPAVTQFDYPGWNWSARMSLDEDVLAARIPGSDDGVTIYRRQAGSWSVEQVIPADHPVGNVAVSGDVLAVHLGEPDGLAVHVYRHLAGVWSFEQRIFRSDLLPGLDVEGDRLVQGWETPGERGRVLVFRFDGTEWVPEASLGGFPSRLEDELGAAVDMEGDRILAGAPNLRVGGPARGSAFVYRHDGTSWVNEARLASPRTTERVGARVQLDFDSQGRPVAAMAESPWRTPFFRGVSVWRLKDGAWQEEAAFPTSDSWALREDSLFLGRSEAPQPGANFAGAIDWYRYTGDWNPVAQLTAGAPRVRAWLGLTLVLADGNRVVGLDSIGTNQSRVHQFEVPELALNAVPDVVSAGDTLNLTLRGGVSGSPYILFVVGVNGAPVFVPVLQGGFGAAGEATVSAVVPSSSTLPGNTVELQAWTLTACGLGSTQATTVTFP